MARTDAVATEGLEAGIERARNTESWSGHDLRRGTNGARPYRKFVKVVKVPVAGEYHRSSVKTPLFTVREHSRQLG